MPPFYRLSDEAWKQLEEEGFIALIVYGGVAWKQPGYKTLLCPHDEPEIRFITDSELDHLIYKLGALQ